MEIRPADASGAGKRSRLSGDRDWLRDLFAPFGPVALRRMFGGLGIYRDGLMFGLVVDGEIYLKADAETAPLFREAGSQPFRYQKGDRIVETSYHSLPEEALDDPDALAALGRPRLCDRPAEERREAEAETPD